MQISLSSYFALLLSLSLGCVWHASAADRAPAFAPVVAPSPGAAPVAVDKHLNQTALYPDALGGLGNSTSLTSVLPKQAFTLARLYEADPSVQCYAEGATDECAKVNSTWDVYQATYTDHSASSLNVCICNGAPFSAEGLAANYSHVPLFLRQWVTSIAAVPATYRSAYTIGSMITFFAESASDWADVMIHESAHAQDHDFSISTTYLDAIGSDTCVPDEYAQTNSVECYAQDMVVFLYALWRPYAPPVGIECMSHQLAALNNSQADGLQAYINATVTKTVPNTCAINCLHTVVAGETLQSLAGSCPGQTSQSLLPYNPQMSNTSMIVYPGELLCFPATCCSSSSRKMLRL